MPESLTLSIHLPVSPERVYQAWLDSAGHSAFTGSPAEVDARPGGKFTAWDGYIWGTTLELYPFHKIIQTWRTTDFAPSSLDSHLEVIFEPDAGGTRLTLIHTDIPEGQAEDYRQGWEDFYFKPMLEYYSSL